MQALLLLACADPAPSFSPLALADLEVRAHGPHVQEVLLSMSGAGSPAVACEAQDDREEIHLVESEEEGSEHRLLLVALRADTTYDCTVYPSGDRFQIATGPLDYEVDLPDVITEGSHRYVTASITAGCVAEPQQDLVVLDELGRPRWHYDPSQHLESADLDFSYAGQGRFVLGGGSAIPPTILDPTGEVVFRMDVGEERVWHHQASLEAMGLLGVADEENEGPYGTYTGVVITIQDPATGETAWEWHGSQAVDKGALRPGYGGDPWHTNWAQQYDDLMVMSMCHSNQVLGVDMDTEEVRWVLDGASECQHDGDMKGDTLLLYDNGRERERTRLMEVNVQDLSTIWEWSVPGWDEPIFGDVDYLPGGGKLVVASHSSCGDGAGTPGWTSEIFELSDADEKGWTLKWPKEDNSIYRAQQLDPCAFGEVRDCPAQAARLAELQGG